MAAIRDALGYDLDVAVDFHGRVHKSMAKVLAKELDAFHLMFIEEPVLPQNNEALREIARYTSTPISTGERMFSRWDFKNLLQDGYVDIIQPDLSHAGGISECKKIAAMAEAYDVAVAPHCPLGPVALSACVQLDICTPMSLSRSRAWVFTITRAATCWTMRLYRQKRATRGQQGRLRTFVGSVLVLVKKRGLFGPTGGQVPFAGRGFASQNLAPQKGALSHPTQSGFSAARAAKSWRGGAVVKDTVSAGSLEFSVGELLSAGVVELNPGVLSSTNFSARVS